MLYAVSVNGYRSITPGMALNPGEEQMSQIPQEVLTRVKADQARAERSYRLRATDWTQMADAPLSVAQKTAWSVYRQLLRDLPTLAGFPDVNWPTPPALDGAAGAAGEGDTVLIP